MQTEARSPAQRLSQAAERLGRYQPLFEVCADPLGGLWVARVVSGKDEGKNVLVRRVAAVDGIDASLVRETCEYAFVVMEVQHPALLGLTDVVIDKGKLGAISEFLEVDSLASLLRASGKPLPVPIALLVITEMLGALSAVHEFALAQEDDPPPVHGGLTPFRVLLAPNGLVKLADVELLSPRIFAAARALDASLSAFASPEHAIDTAVLDARTDVFQAGVMLWQMLSAKPMPGETPAPRLQDVPAALADVVERALAPRPEARFDSATALRDALASAASGAIATPEQLGKFVAATLEPSFDRQRKALAPSESARPATEPSKPSGVVRPGARPIGSLGTPGAPPRPSGGPPGDAGKGLTPRPGGFAARLAERSAKKDGAPDAKPVAPAPTPGAPQVKEAIAPPKPDAKPDEMAAQEPAAAPGGVADAAPADGAAAPQGPSSSRSDTAAKGSDSDRVDEIPPPPRAQINTLDLDDGEMVEEPAPVLVDSGAAEPPSSGGLSDTAAVVPAGDEARPALETEDLEALTPPRSRKKLYAIVGGVLGLAVVLLVIALASGGGSRTGEVPATRTGTSAEAPRTGQTPSTAAPTAAETATAAVTASATPAESAAPAETAAASVSAAPVATAPAVTAKPVAPVVPGPYPGAKKPKYVPKGI